ERRHQRGRAAGGTGAARATGAFEDIGGQMPRHPILGTFAIGTGAACVLALGLRLTTTAAQTAGQTPGPAPPAASNCQPGQDLITVPEIASDPSRHLLRAELRLTSGKRTLWGSVGDTRCVQQDIRYFTGRNLLTSG